MRSEGRDEEKQTNEIKTAKPLLDAIDIAGRTITADALLTQRELADYLVGRGANYHFTAKGNQPTLLEAIAYYFQNQPPMPADFVQTGQGEHGRIETRKIWTTTALNDYLAFPHVRQTFMIERESIDKKSGEHSRERIYGITSVPAWLSVKTGYDIVPVFCVRTGPARFRFTFYPALPRPPAELTRNRANA